MMTGLQDTREACKPLFSPRSLTFPLSSRSLFRRAPDPAKQDCIRRQQRHAIDLADPAGGLLQLAQAAIPPRPGPGQAVGVPIEDILLEGVAIIVPVYRVEVFNARAQVQEGVDAGMLARAAVAVSIVARLVYATGFLEEIWVSKDSLVKNYGEDKFVCLKDLICVDEECGGQEDGKTLKTGFTPICKKVSITYDLVGGCAFANMWNVA